MYKAGDGFKKLREATAAAKFALVLSGDRPVSIELESDRFPDFTLRVGNNILAFEQTEADRPGRRRGDEYRRAARRKAEGLPLPIEQYDPAGEEQDAIPAIIEAIQKKANRRNSPPPNLLVYVNFSCDWEKPPITGLIASQLAHRWRADFESCWLLWEDRIFRLWPRPAMIRSRGRLALVDT
jgi:hypothetical protein